MNEGKPAVKAEQLKDVIIPPVTTRITVEERQYSKHSATVKTSYNKVGYNEIAAPVKWSQFLIFFCTSSTEVGYYEIANVAKGFPIPGDYVITSLDSFHK